MTESATPVSVWDVRQWARSRGIPVGTRGRIAPDLVDTYNRAHRTRKYTGPV